MSDHLPTLAPGGEEKLSKLLRETVDSRQVPACFFGATNVEKEIYFDQYGDKVFGKPEEGQVDSDTVTEIFSQTKLLTCVALLQLVDKGLVDLDDPLEVEESLPEIGKIPLLKGYESDGTPILVKPENKVTVRMLMSHTAGCTYSHSDPFLKPWLDLNPLPTLFDPKATLSILCTPLIYEPGTSWKYSHSIDWVGILIERKTKMSLEDYFMENLFKPYDIHSMTFYPTDKVRDSKMSVCYRDPQNSVQLVPGGYGMNRPSGMSDITSQSLLLGGAGLFGTQRDYLTFLRHLLRCHPKYEHLKFTDEKQRLLSRESFDELWKPCVTPQGVEKILEMVKKPDYIHPEPTVDTLNHSVGFLITSQPFQDGRRENSGCWSGAAKTQFWIDPETGIAAVCGTQLLSPSPDPWYAHYVAYERALYSVLQ